MIESLAGNLLVASARIQGGVQAQSVCLTVHEDEQSVIGLVLNRPLRFVEPAALAGVDSVAEPGNDNDNDHHGIVNTPAAPTATRNTVPQPDIHPQGVAEAVTPLPLRLPKAPGEVLAINPGGLPKEWERLPPMNWGGPMPGPVVAVHATERWAQSTAGDGVYLSADRDLITKLGESDDPTTRMFVGCVGWSIDQLGAELRDGWWHTAPASAATVFAAPEEMWPRLIRRSTGRSFASWINAADDPRSSWLN